MASYVCDSLTDEHDGDAPVPLLPVSLLLGGEGERGGLRRLQHLPQQQERRRQHDRSRDDQHAHRVRDHDVVPEAKKEKANYPYTRIIVYMGQYQNFEIYSACVNRSVCVSVCSLWDDIKHVSY